MESEKVTVALCAQGIFHYVSVHDSLSKHVDFSTPYSSF